MTRYLTPEEIIAINLQVIREFSPNEQAGVRAPELLDSALNRPRQSVFGQDAYPTIYDKAAALFESLVQNHPFHNANKRTAFLALLQFLSYNGYTFMMEPKQAEDFVVDVVNHKYAFEEIVGALRRHAGRR
ncbi:type II toxin-antitoxin system death-on-curing family toxin [Kyrpidia tusciae]|uniref:Death-on-curing family protein n=1 Tax=Kyrpidia tusciae (strain DSM 2912 / NBRC 15312 / T2) TaxID=562970 RepID=D5WX17_KYRT2|nr:type II toxin-antitoxin system death-on-curing family toxin [Kyrpidia tusciae]ADG07798.1 death-on-curing family protein [Kyrpidia tusciae DSM 2912]